MMTRPIALLVLGIASLHPLDARSQSGPYSDDRSDAVSLIQSYYNAVNRKEYARAWGYYGDRKPAADFDAFAQGYADTAQVELVTGAVSEEGAAGSSFFNVPVAIRATNADGSEQVFSGCMMARLANPQIQGVPFQPLHISEWSFLQAEEPLENAVPERCGDVPAPAKRDALLDQARKRFEISYAGSCGWGAGQEEAANAPEAYTIEFRTSYSSPDEPPQEAHLFRFFCGMGAYNETHVYYLWTDPDGLRHIQFATPDLDIGREDESDFESAVEEIRINGYSAQDQLVNSFYSAEDHTITSNSKWRGVGDASSSGLWLFRDGQFVLVRYEVDASYDGEINPQTVLDYFTAP